MRVERIPWSGGQAPEEEQLRSQLLEDGFDPFRWRDTSGATYDPHSHAHDESLWLIEGEISFGIGGHTYKLMPGDRLMLPAGTVHTAVAGTNGALYLIGQRLGGR